MKCSLMQTQGRTKLKLKPPNTLLLKNILGTTTIEQRAGAISGLGPCVSVALSVFCLGERPNRRAYIGMGFCVLGLLVMTAHHWGYRSIWGIGLAALAAAFGGAFNAMQKVVTE